MILIDIQDLFKIEKLLSVPLFTLSHCFAPPSSSCPHTKFPHQVEISSIFILKVLASSHRKLHIDNTARTYPLVILKYQHSLNPSPQLQMRGVWRFQNRGGGVIHSKVILVPQKILNKTSNFLLISMNELKIKNFMWCIYILSFKSKKIYIY